MSTHKKIAIIGGGTNTYVSNHLALSAPAYGTTAFNLAVEFEAHPENKMKVDLYLTKMASKGVSDIDTPEDVEALVDKLIADPDTRVIIFNVAMVDYKPDLLQVEDHNGWVTETVSDFGKYNRRLNSKHDVNLYMSPQDKIIQKIRKERKDILLVGFKTTCDATKEEQFQKGLKLCKEASANIVFVNDVDKERIEKLNNLLMLKEESLKNPIQLLNSVSNVNKESTLPSIIGSGNGTLTFKDLNTLLDRELGILDLQNNGLVTPEESSYWYNTREEALDALVQMVLDRSHLHFTRSTVVDSETISWDSKLIPQTFKTIFDFVRGAGAYKLGPTKSTVGHFGLALGPNEFLTSKRKTDFNKIEEVGLVKVITDDPDNVFGYKHFFEESDNDKVIAFGAKPSVGGQSQRSLFETFPNLDCIIHFHCPLKPESRSLFNTTLQFSFECGSKECIASNLTGFKEYKVSSTHSIWAGHMDYHGPNIVFNSDIDPQLVINFIDKYWDLSRKTDGLSEENK